MIHCVKDAVRLSKMWNEKSPLDLASWWGMARAVLAQWESESDWRGLKNGLVMLQVMEASPWKLYSNSRIKISKTLFIKIGQNKHTETF